MGAALQAEADPFLPYADTEWVSLHAGPKNDDFVDVEVGRGWKLAWTALEGAATVVAPVIGPDGTIYQTVGLGPGNSNLYAFDQDGNLLWQSEPWEDASGFDSCAFIESPIVDTDGDLYVADCNQLWAFHGDGTVKWVTDLPAAPAGVPFQEDIPRNPPLTAFFMNGDTVGLATFYGQVGAWSMQDGSPVADVIDLPGGPGPGPAPTPPGMFAGVADPGVAPLTFNMAWGIYGEVIDTPAVHPETGRVFILGSGSIDGTTSIYGVDFVPGTGLVIAWEALVGVGGGASPTISPDLKTVYTTDGTGKLTGVDTETGAVVFSVQTTNTRPQSPSIGADGKIYLAEGQAINPDGTLAWTADFSGLLASLFGDQPQILPFLSTRIAGVFAVTKDRLMFPVVINTTLDPSQFPFLPQPVDVPLRMVMVSADPHTGELLPGVLPYTFMENENSGFTVPLKNGLVVTNRGDFVIPLTAQLAPLANYLVQSIAPGIDLHAQSAAIGGMEVVRTIDEVTIVDATNGTALVDGPLSSGDFVVNPNPAAGEPAVSGAGTVGTATVTVTIYNLPNGGNKGIIFVSDPEKGIDATIKIQDSEFSDAPNTAKGTGDSGKYIDQKNRNFTVDWLIRDWS